jgi:CheY-like chemotaxis protein
MERQLNQMTRLIDDLLDTGRISQGKLELRRKRVELASVIHQAVEGCRSAIESAGQEIVVTLPQRPIYLDADSIRLAQVFTNLLSNASKYSDPGSRILLTAVQEGGDAVVSVKDTGIGIPPEMLQKIFDMFTQVDQSLERTRGGLGIGLTLVRQLVELHGGSVHAFSEGLGRGSEFVVRLPVLSEAPESQPREAVTGVASPTSGRRILVVDDNRDAAGSLAMLLKMTGNETQIACDGLEAVHAAETFKPDIVLLDIGLPKLNGYDACRRIREQPWGKHMALIALTGWGQEADRQKSKDAGFDGHLVKPVDYAALMKVLAESQQKPAE